MNMDPWIIMAFLICLLVLLVICCFRAYDKDPKPQHIVQGSAKENPSFVRVYTNLHDSTTAEFETMVLYENDESSNNTDMV